MNYKSITGTLIERFNKYVLIDDDGQEYTLYAIKMYTSVDPSVDTGRFKEFVGKRVIASGDIKGSEIWGTGVVLEEEDKQRKKGKK